MSILKNCINPSWINRRAGNADAIKKALEDMYKVKISKEELIEEQVKEPIIEPVKKEIKQDDININKIEPKKKKKVKSKKSIKLNENI